MSTQAKHHKPSNRNACLIQCTCNSYNTVRECCIHLCWLCPQAWSTQIEYGTSTIPVFSTNTLCCIMCRVSVNKCAHVQNNNLAVCMLTGGRQRKNQSNLDHLNVQGCLCHCQKTASTFNWWQWTQRSYEKVLIIMNNRLVVIVILIPGFVLKASSTFENRVPEENFEERSRHMWKYCWTPDYGCILSPLGTTLCGSK